MPERMAANSIHCSSCCNSSTYLSHAGTKDLGKTFSSAATASAEEEEIGEEVVLVALQEKEEVGIKNLDFKLQLSICN